MAKEMPFVFDLHQDLIYQLAQRWQNLEKPLKNWHGDIPSFKKANYKLIVTAVFPLHRFWDSRLPEDPLKFTLRAIEKIKELARKFYPQTFVLVENKKDLKALINSDKIGLLISLEGAYGIEDPLLLHALFELGVRILGPVWNIPNLWAQGAKFEKTDKGLTDFGYKMIELADEIGFIIDLAHSSPTTINEVLEIPLSKPPLVTHTGILRNPRNPRNLNFEIAGKITERGGIIGIAFANLFFEKKKIDLKRFSHVLKELINTFPGLAIGTDFFGFSKEDEIKGLERADRLVNLYKELLKLKVGLEKIEKFFYKNALNYLEKWLPD